MSLINEALKSIQNKNIKSAEIIPIPIVLLESKRQKIFIKNMITYLFAVLFLALTITLIIKLFSPTNKLMTVMPPISTTSTSNKTLLTVSPNAIADTATINGVSINIKDNITEIIFSFNKQVLYHVSSELLSNKINISFDNTEFVATIPDYKTMGSGIDNIDYQNKKNSALLSLTLLPKSVISYLHFNEDKKHPELMIAISNHAGDESKVTNFFQGSSSNTTSVIRPAKIDTIQDRYLTIMHDIEKNGKNKSLILLKQLLADEPSYKDARVSYAAMLIDDEQFEEAIKVLDKGLNQDDEFLPYVELKSRVYMLTEQSNLAINLMNKYSPPMDTHLRFYELLASLYQNTHQYQEAMDIYKNLLSIDNTHYEWWLSLGMSLEKTMALDDAEMAYKKALSFNTGNTEVNEYLKQRLASLGERHAASK